LFGAPDVAAEVVEGTAEAMKEDSASEGIPGLAFVEGWPATMPSADFCTAVRAPYVLSPKRHDADLSE
jgi:hypothetical protein